MDFVSNKSHLALNKNGYFLLESIVTLAMSLIILTALSSSIIHITKMMSMVQARLSQNSEFIAQSMALEQLITHSSLTIIQDDQLILQLPNQHPITVGASNKTVWLKHGRAGKRKFIENIESFKIYDTQKLEVIGKNLHVKMSL